MSKKKKRLLVVLACVLVAALCLMAGIFGMRLWNNQVENSVNRFRIANADNIVDLLYLQKHPYIGRLPSDLLQLLTDPRELYYFATQLHTREAPYGLELWYGTDEAGYQALFAGPGRQGLLQKNALIIMALIDNCDFVQYSIKWDDKRIDYSDYDHSDLERMGRDGFTLTYNRAWADAAIGGDIKAAAETEEGFRAFLGSIDQLELPAARPEAMEQLP